MSLTSLKDGKMVDRHKTLLVGLVLYTQPDHFDLVVFLKKKKKKGSIVQKYDIRILCLALLSIGTVSYFEF